MEFVIIPEDTFIMGADKKLENAFDSETPKHQVTISKPFYLGIYEVTQEQWLEVMGADPSNFKGRSNPVEQVSWDDVQIFIKLLSAKEGHNRYRLPTESEWEYAARSGTESMYFFGNDAYSLDQYAWYENNSEGTTHPVGKKEPNAWGLYDMYGNVHEWVQDWVDEDNYYQNSPSTDPKGLSSGSYRVRRGGGWFSLAGYCRSASRNSYTPDFRNNSIGFRLAISIE